MGWPYEFITLSSEERRIRRQTLDRYSSFAQLSVLVPVALYLLWRLTAWATKAAKSQRGSYTTVPNSPSLKSRRLSAAGSWTTHARQVQWWLGDEIVLLGLNLGPRDELIFGFLWAVWLTLLCVIGTGKDYLHLTKRFGMIATSQFPVQYLMSLKSLNPFAFVFGSSHEQVNRWHRVLGRIIYVLLCVHAILYANYFIWMGIFRRRMTALIVALGVLAFLGMTLLTTTALKRIRTYSYRLFFIVHLVVALAVPPLIIFHAKPATIYMVEALLVFVVDLVSRKIDTVTTQAVVESVPRTSLVKISAPIPQSKLKRFLAFPGSHIFLNVPAAARSMATPAAKAHLLFEFLFNPFTVAGVDEEASSLTLVTRARDGPMSSALARFSQGNQAGAGSTGVVPLDLKIPLNIEGPYGAATHFEHLVSGDFDRFLLVAGGVGATFIVPLYRSIRKEIPSAKLEMVWAMRSAGEATWAVTGGETKSLLDDENVHLYLSGDIVTRSHYAGELAGSNGNEPSTSAEGVELGNMYRDRRRDKYTSEHNRKRPDLQRIVDGVFRHGAEERVAILVCGPVSMTRELREHVGVWVMKGRKVWWHSENFDW